MFPDQARSDKLLDAKGNAAKSLTVEATLEDPGSEEKEQLFRRSMEIGNEAYGEVSSLSCNLYYNIALLYQDRQQYYEAYGWFVKCKAIHDKIYGKDHPLTKGVDRILAEGKYVRIKKERHSENK
ncbi:uncharacterized protein [Amphiura filiformis]|uniref:uncharacterized protein n=1 Tax=Amphiura filiformis TaxID=82378 RepID=UPI003B21190F